MKRETTFSYDRRYRYTLWREWGCDLFDGDWVSRDRGFVQFIGLNPSTADETLDDPTIRRCIGFARSWGYGALCMTNLFAFRATQPYVMKAMQQCIGGDNTNQLMEVAEHAAIIICAWGRDGNHLGRQEQVVDALQPWKEKLHHLGLNSDGTPKHPLYLRADTKPQPFLDHQPQPVMR